MSDKLCNLNHSLMAEDYLRVAAASDFDFGSPFSMSSIFAFELVAGDDNVGEATFKVINIVLERSEKYQNYSPSRNVHGFRHEWTCRF